MDRRMVDLTIKNRDPEDCYELLELIGEGAYG